jgi:protein Tex
MPSVVEKIVTQIAHEIGCRPAQVQAALHLLDGGATVPFVARYRKEVTGGLDDIQLRALADRSIYLRELEDRRGVVRQSIADQGKLNPGLELAIDACQTKQELEDLYLPYKPKRRTKGMIAREAGLEALAQALWANPHLVPVQEAQAYVREVGAIEGADFSTPQAVLDGVRDLLSESWAETPHIIQSLRQWLWDEGLLCTQRNQSKPETDPEVAKFRDYFEYTEPISQVPSHRALAALRGRSQDILELTLGLPVRQEPGQPSVAEGRIALSLQWSHQGRPADDFLRRCVAWTWRVKLSLSIERDLFSRLREEAEKVAIDVFAENLRDLLLAAPAGHRTVMGLDPGIRTGVKVAVVDATGKVLTTETVYPHEPRRDLEGALRTLGTLCVQHGVELIAIGNGTASRETDKLVGELIRRLPETEPHGKPVQRVVISEAGASVYSASEFASQELPELDVSLRGAVSIARRLQDPLAELVKIDPKSIGVGQYQHDLNQAGLARSLDAIVEDCVNSVGVDLNTASIPLLSRVSGLSNSTARAIVRIRDQQGAFTNRQQLLQVPGLGAKTFEQAAAFLRLPSGENPLDMTAVHPEAYSVVERILDANRCSVRDLMGQTSRLKTIKAEQFANERFGVPTITDILGELAKPGRDPRPEFVVARFNEGVEDIRDLREGMILDGTVSNVAAFGAFVDLGVHQDGLVHVSQMSERFITDARQVVRAGQVVRVKVLEVDPQRKRISLSLRLSDAPAMRNPKPAGQNLRTRQSATAHQSTAATPTAMAQAFSRLKP